LEYLKQSKLNIETYDNAIILPRKSIENEYPLWGLGGVCDQNNQFIKTSFYDGGWATFGGAYQYEQEKLINEDVLYIGLFFSHWGHFLIDLTCRLWAVPRLLEEKPSIKVAYLGEEEPIDNNLRFFELLGVKKEQLLLISEPTRFRRVFVPEQGFKSCEWYTSEHLHMLNLIVEHALGSGDNYSKIDGLKRVYFSRRSFFKAVSSEYGEEYFEKIFNTNGFTSIAPEQLTLDEQIYIWNNADEIICVNGSIPLNVMFCCNQSLRLIILNKTKIPHDNPIILLKMRGVEATFLNVFYEPFKKYPKSLGEGPYLFWPTEEFSEYINQRSFINTFSVVETKWFFFKQRLEYYLYFVGLNRRTRKIISKITPRKIKELRNKFAKKI